MWKTRLCLATSPGFGCPVEEQIRLFRKVGFDGFFTGWSRGCEIERWKQTAQACGMLYHAVHAPFDKAAELWTSGEKADAAVEELTACLRDSAQNGVKIVILHAFIGFDDHSPNAAGIENFKKLAAEAEQLGIRIALENTEGEEYLDALMNALRDCGAVGYCWDSGHEMCYNHSQDLLAKYGDRLLITHLNDNLGIRDYEGNITWKDDLHLLPFDGIADWEELMRRLNKCRFDGILTFELNKNSKPDRYDNECYAEMSIENYVTEAYKRACRVASIRSRLCGDFYTAT